MIGSRRHQDAEHPSRTKAMLRACAVLAIALLALTLWRDIATYLEQRARTAARLRALQDYERSLRGGGFVRAQTPVRFSGQWMDIRISGQSMNFHSDG